VFRARGQQLPSRYPRPGADDLDNETTPVFRLEVGVLSNSGGGKVKFAFLPAAEQKQND